MRNSHFLVSSWPALYLPSSIVKLSFLVSSGSDRDNSTGFQREMLGKILRGVLVETAVLCLRKECKA